MGKWLALSGLSGFLAVLLGAFGAHGLSGQLAGVAEGAKRLGWWETAAHYQLIHALALGLVAAIIGRVPRARYAGRAFTLGSLLFSGSLYAMALGGPRWLGMLTPLGGLSLLVGWGVLAWCGARREAE